MTTPRVTLDAYTGHDRLRIAIAGDVVRDQVKRSEGGVMMSLVDPVLSVEAEGVDFAAIHPDLLALIGVLAFHPALPEEPFELVTSFPVSPRVQAALDRPWILPGVRVTGTGTADPYEPVLDTVLSYGGGIDSLAASILYPGVPLVHESPMPSRRGAFTDCVNDVVVRGQGNHVVYDNLRQLFTTWGLPLWVSVYVASLVTQPRNILSGSEMTGTYLLGGVEYKPRYANVWYRVFRTIGVTVLPTSFLSEIGNAKIVTDAGRMRDAAYCTMISRHDCDHCTKCLRRRCIRAFHDSGDLALVDAFKQSDKVAQFLAKRPLYYGDIFMHAVAGLSRETWVHEHVADLLHDPGRLSFHDGYNPDTFEHFGYPDNLRKQAERGLGAAGIPPFDERMRAAFEQYRQLT